MIIQQSSNEIIDIDNQDGFTLVEIAVVAIIFGFIMSGAVMVYDNYRQHAFVLETLENIEVSSNEVSNFYGRNGRYPCPADPTLAPGDALYGISQCGADPANGICAPNIVCTRDGGHDARGDGVDDFVMIGALPVQTLDDDKDIQRSKFVQVAGMDGNRNKLTYAISAEMVSPGFSPNNPANPSLGGVVVWDENGRPVLDPDHPDNPDTGQYAAHFIVVSHGSNARGGYSLNGARIGDCNVSSGPLAGGVAPPGFGDGAGGMIDTEVENCDYNDAIFVSALKNNVDGDQYYDDFINPEINNITNLWRQASPAAENGGRRIYNNNIGDVALGPGLTSADSKLQVAGNIRAENQIEAHGGLCNTLGDCVYAEFLAGHWWDGSLDGTHANNQGVGDGRCPPGQIAVGIDNSTLRCEPLFTEPVAFQCDPEDPNIPVGDPILPALDENGNGINDQRFLAGFKVRRIGGTSGTTEAFDLDCRFLP